MAGWPKELDLAEGDLVAYVGPNADGYLDYLRSCRAAGKFRMGFLWSAFATPPIWLAYRKLWLWMLVALVVGIGMPKILPAAASGVATGIGVAFAMMGKSLIVRGAWKAAQEADEDGLQGEGRRAFLRRKGGTSPVAAVIASLVLSLAVVVLIIGAVQGHLGSEKDGPSTSNVKTPMQSESTDPLDHIYKPSSGDNDAKPSGLPVLRHSVE